MKNKLIAVLSSIALLAAAGCADSDSSSVPVSTTETTPAAEAAAVTETAEATESTTTTTATTPSETLTTTETTTSETTPTTLETITTSETTTATVTTTAPKTTAATTTKKKTTTAQTVRTTAKTTTAPKPASTAEAEMSQLIKAHNSSNCAVLVYSMDGEELFSYNPNKLIYGASLIKLPYVYYCCTQLSKGIHNLNETMTYTQSWYHGGSGVIAYSGYGKKYTISQLIDYALRYSDNVAYDMLVYLFGTSGFNQMIKSWGYDISISQGHHFTSVTASFMKTSMQKMQAMSKAGGSWSIAWTALNESTNNYSRAAIGGSDPIAVKYGNVSYVWHETCYVSGSTPYILVILSGANNYQADVNFVTKAAKCADKMVKQHYQQMMTTTTTTTTSTTTTTTTETTLLPTTPASTTTAETTPPPEETTSESTTSTSEAQTTLSEESTTTTPKENSPNESSDEQTE